MNIKIKYTFLAIFVVAISFATCKKSAQYSVIDDAIYISEAAQGASKKLIIDEQGATVTVTPRLVQKGKNSVTASIVVDTASLTDFNKRNGTNYLPIPAELLTFSTNTINIPAGAVSAPAVRVIVKPFTEQMQASGDKYALSLSLKDINGTATLASSSNFVYEFEPVIITSVPILTGSTQVKMAMRQDYTLQAWSVEMRVNMSLLGKGIGELNNQAIFGAFDPSEIYIRFGDAPIPGNILQIKHQGTQINSKTAFSANKWYHLAFTSDGNTLKIYIDGELDATLALPGKPTGLSKNGFYMANGSSYLKAKVMMSEVRFWTKTISQDQIRNNMFAINPKSDGLEAYWKMNEGSGNVFQDATGHGNTATAAGSINWKAGVRSDDK